jgi:hypothetical protein
VARFQAVTSSHRVRIAAEALTAVGRSRRLPDDPVAEIVQCGEPTSFVQIRSLNEFALTPLPVRRRHVMELQQRI